MKLDGDKLLKDILATRAKLVKEGKNHKRNKDVFVAMSCLDQAIGFFEVWQMIESGDYTINEE